MGRPLPEALSRRVQEKVVGACARLYPRRRTVGLFVLLTLALIFTRLWNLGDKPYHHDEGIYATLSWRFFKNFDYHFSPVTHGPFLFISQGLLFRLFEPTNFTGRLPVALAGILFPAVGLFLFRHQTQRLVWLILCVTSPILCYFSRFLGMDLLMVLWATCLVVTARAWWQSEKPLYLYLASLFLSLMVCTKLNWLFYAFTFMSFLVLSGHTRAFFQKLFSRKYDALGSLIVFLYVYCLLYSVLGRDFKGIWAGFFGEMLPYWIHQNKIQRIAGPYHYYLTLISIYELPLVIGLIFLGFRAWKDRLTRPLMNMGLVAASISGLGLYFIWPSLGLFPQKILHMTHAAHVALFIFEVTLGFSVLKWHLHREQRFKAFLSYWLFTSLILYSYAGEKIPWLTVHLILPAYLYFAASITIFPRVWAAPIIVAVLLWQGFNVYRANFDRPENPVNRLAYTHTTLELRQFSERVHALKKLKPDLTIYVMNRAEAVWPLTWYLRDFTDWFQGHHNLYKKPHIVVENPADQETTHALIPEYTLQSTSLRAWWVPAPDQYSLKNFANYYVNHQAFNAKGYTHMAVFIHPDILGTWNALP